MNEKIIQLLAHADYAPSNVPQLLQLLELPRNQQQALQKNLHAMEHSGQVVRTKGNRYILAAEADLVPGTIQITRGGRGFVQPDQEGVIEIAVPASETFTAMHGDRVLVRRDVPAPGKTEPQNSGTVVKILERKRVRFVGTLRSNKQFLYVVPDDPRMTHDLIVPQPKDVGRTANEGDKVVVELTEWESRHTGPLGEIVEVLGPPGEEGVDMLSVLRQYDLPLSFPKTVLREAESIVRNRSLTDAAPEDMQGRVDCRAHRVITIDPDDAKDFDDAIALEPLPGDRWNLWVHIADVSHYVTPGSALDVEARKRGNSTYLVDRVIPMLPEALSNELCSLKPQVDRLTKCVEFVLGKHGEVISSKFYSAVIRSKHRFTYKEVFACLQTAPTNDIETMVHQANTLAQAVRRNRFKAGSLDLDFPESKIRLDDHGAVRVIERIENDESHQLIEEFMLLANEAVATRLMMLEKPAIYRIHEAPKTDRLFEYRDLVMSHKIPCGKLTMRAEVQKLLTLLGTIPIGPALKVGFLKSLMRARYANEPLGHYGLSKPKYTHFTSPIRRYADLIVHRVMFDGAKLTKSHLHEVAQHITITERNSSDAERDSREVKLFAYLKAQIKSRKPQIYNAMVTDVRNFVFFVDVTDLGMSGGVPLSSIKDDFFTFDPKRRELLGRRSRRVIKLGDLVQVQVCKVDEVKKQVDFQLVPSNHTSEHSSGNQPPHLGEPCKERRPDKDRGRGQRGRRPEQKSDKRRGRK